ncbi:MULTISPECIES: hypothetical protein [unclassified Mesorhizobium]|nr:MULTISPECIES: hypothetical protein [unclassified Mesorhizobium]UCI24602.1 hypothetical protein FJ430_23855 [Mesorhizobium sp. B2-8-5]
MDFVEHIFAGIWGAGVLAAIWYAWTRPSPPATKKSEDRDLREWLDDQL